MTRRHFKRLAVAITVLLLSIITCYATGWIYERWCEWVLGILFIAVIAYPIILSRKNKD